MTSFFFFFFKQKTAYDMRISDWSSDVCSSDLGLASNWFNGKAGASDLLHSILRHPRPHRWRLFAPDFRQISQHLLLIGLNLLPNVCLSKWRFHWNERHPDKHPGDRKSTRLNSSH